LDTISLQFTEQVRAQLALANNITILTHKNPDGDAMGSGLALYNYLQEKGKNSTFIVPNDLANYLNWMPGVENTIVYETDKDKAETIIAATELLFFVDFNHSSRLSAANDKIAGLQIPKIMIDHHPEPENIANIVYSRISASSTCEMVYELLNGLENDNTLSKDVATCLMVGIITDTGKFSHNSSNPATFMAAAGMLKAGIDKDFIVDKIYNNYSEDRLRLLGHTMCNKMVIIPEYGTAFISLSLEEQQKFNFQKGDAEGFVNYPLSIAGITLSAFFMEKENMVKCSFRSKGDFPANILSQNHFKGGGHLNAAGGESQLSLNETIEKFKSILPEFEKYFNNAKA